MLKTENAEVASDPLKSIWNFLASVKLTIVLLLSLAITSIFGTLIPQNENPSVYFRAYGETIYRLFDVLKLFDMYHSWWFQLLLILLTINVIICSMDRLPGTWKTAFVKHPPFHLDRFHKLEGRLSFKSTRSPDALVDLFESQLKKRFAYCRAESVQGGTAIFAEKGRWTRLGPYVVHFSIVLLLIGGLIGSIYGFDGFVNVPEGQTVMQIHLRNTGESLAIPFGIRCDDFNVSFYDSGQPKEYRSTLTIIENNKPILTRDIIVNDPLRHRGLNIFQSSYGSIEPEKVTLSFTSAESEIKYLRDAQIDQAVEIPEGLGTFTLKRFESQAGFMGHSIGEAFIGVLEANNKEPLEIVIPLRFAGFDKMRKGDVVISVENYEQRYFTGLQVTKDPGVPVVYSGFIFIIVGCFITFFTAHQRICVEIQRSGNKSVIYLSGTANKGKTSMQEKVKKIIQELENLASAKQSNID